MNDIKIYKNYYLKKWSNKHSRSRVGVICTIGPSVFDPPEIDRIEELIKHGMNIARINLSHFLLDENNGKALPADLEKITAIIKRIRECSDKLQIPVNIMLDLKGPEIRVSFFSVPNLNELAPLAELEIKERFQFTMVSVKYTGLASVKRHVVALSKDENELINTFENESEYRLSIGKRIETIVKCERKNNDGSFDFIIKEVLPTEDKPILKCHSDISIISNVEGKGAKIKSKIAHIYEPVLQIQQGKKLVLTDKKKLAFK